MQLLPRQATAGDVECKRGGLEELGARRSGRLGAFHTSDSAPASRPHLERLEQTRRVCVHRICKETTVFSQGHKVGPSLAELVYCALHVEVLRAGLRRPLRHAVSPGSCVPAEAVFES